MSAIRGRPRARHADNAATGAAGGYPAAGASNDIDAFTDQVLGIFGPREDEVALIALRRGGGGYFVGQR